MTHTLDYIPFGAQYYRAPTPLVSDWEADLGNIRQAGFNTIKVWAQWRWNHPEPDRFDFSDLSALLDLAQQCDLSVVINLILDCAPAWLYARHPDCRMVTASGRALGPVTTSYRQVGGVPAHCFHHDAAVQHSVRFVEETAKAFADHPALAFWDLWNEPELTVGLLREPAIADLVCFCPHSRKAFVRWLRSRYVSLKNLNRAWSRNYCGWEDIELPEQPHTYRDFIDWRMFFAATMRDELVRRKNAVRKGDSTRPVMCHTVPFPIFPLVSCAADDWLLAQEGDLHGNSVGSDPFAADLLRSAARGKTVINAEIHALPGGTFSRPRPIGEREMKRHILIPLSHGIRGFLFWQYRPERLGAESPAWGLTNPDGTPSPWLEPISRIARAVLAEEEFFLNAAPLPAKIAILADAEDQVFCWAAALSGDFYARSLDGAYRALARAGHQVDFLHPADFQKGLHRNYRCIYMPVPYWLSEPVASRLAEYVEQGGSLVSELWAAAYDSRECLHSVVTPGMGLDTLFASREKTTWPLTSGFDAYAMWKTPDGCEAGPTVTLTSDIGSLSAGASVPLVHAVSEYETSAEILATLPNGGAVVVRNRAGAGSAILAGAPLGLAASQEEGAPSAALIAALVEDCAGGPDLAVEGPGRADLLELNGRRFIVLSNDSGEDASIGVRLVGQARGFLGNEPGLACEGEWMRARLPARAAEAYWLDWASA